MKEAEKLKADNLALKAEVGRFEKMLRWFKFNGLRSANGLRSSNGLRTSNGLWSTNGPFYRS